MAKKDLMKSAASVLVIIVLAVLIVNANKLISPKSPQISAEGQNGLSRGSAKDYGECFDEEPSTVIFVHSNSCPHCRNMMPIIEELEKEGYNFYWAEGSDSEARGVIDNCFGDLLSGYVPQFICPATGEERTGEMSKDELRAFADKCVS